MAHTNFFFQYMFKDPFNYERGMCGTITCRPTVAYRVQSDGINSSYLTDYKILPKQDIDPMLF